MPYHIETTRHLRCYVTDQSGRRVKTCPTQKAAELWVRVLNKGAANVD